MAKYTVFESTNMASTKYAERIFDAVADKDIENGTFGYLNGLADGESVIYNFVAGYKKGEDIVVVDNPAWTENESKITNQRRDKYINEAGVPFRVRSIKKRDEFAITIEGITEATRTLLTNPTDKDAPIYLTIDENTGKLVASTTTKATVAETDDSTDTSIDFEATIMRKRMVGGLLSTPLRNYGYSNPIYEAKITTLK